MKMGDEVSKPPSSEEGIVPTIQNVVSTLNLGCKIDLRSLVLNGTPNAEYCPRRFPGVVMRIKNPRTTALIFSSGKMVCTGARSEHQSKLAATKFYRIIKKQLAAVKFNDFKIRNIVASCDVQFPIRLDLLARSADGAFSNYDPELFPALTYRMRTPMMVVSIFTSGKIVLAGAKHSLF